MVLSHAFNPGVKLAPPCRGGKGEEVELEPAVLADLVVALGDVALAHRRDKVPAPPGRDDAQPGALVIGRHYITERGLNVIVRRYKYNAIVQHSRYWYTVVLWLTLVVTNHKSRLRLLT